MMLSKRDVIKFIMAILLFWGFMEFVAFILALLFMNEITAALTVMATFYGLIWCLYKVTTLWLDERNKGE